MNKGKPLTNEQKEFIRANFKELSRERMARELKVSFKKVEQLCVAENLKRSRYVSRGIYKARTEDASKPKINRPPAHYSNRSREEVISYYEKLEV